MKKKSLLFSLALGLTYLTISSHKSGLESIGENRTGAAGSTATCAGTGCHPSNSTTVFANFKLEDMVTGTTVNISGGQYIPGRTYKVTLAGTYPLGGFNKFGFQATVTDGASITAGTVSLIDTAKTRITTALSTVVVEHKDTIVKTASTMFGEFYWKAPAKGAGSVRFYGMFLAVNGTGTEKGDLGNSVFRDLTEDVNVSINELKTSIATSVYPNPCTNVLNIETKANESFTANIYEIAGKVVLNSTENKIDVSSLNPGFYFLNISNGEGNQTIPFVKQ